MRCADVESLVHPYVDGELVADDNELLERHASDCERCRALVSFHAGFKANVRARLKPRGIAGAPVQDEVGAQRLKTSVLAALDRADARGEGPVARPWRRFAPLGAIVFAAAAAVAFFVGSHTSEADSPIVGEAIRAHEKNLPVEVGGPDVDVVRSWYQGKVGVPVRPPRLRADAALLGGRVYHLRDRDVGQLIYRVGDSRYPTQMTTTMTVYVFDPAGWDFSAPTRRRVAEHDVFLAEERGYSVVLFRDRGVGYAFASDLGGDELLRLVTASLRDSAP